MLQKVQRAELRPYGKCGLGGQETYKFDDM
jgi:hypothetical protein